MWDALIESIQDSMVMTNNGFFPVEKGSFGFAGPSFIMVFRFDGKIYKGQFNMGSDYYVDDSNKEIPNRFNLSEMPEMTYDYYSPKDDL